MITRQYFHQLYYVYMALQFCPQPLLANNDLYFAYKAMNITTFIMHTQQYNAVLVCTMHTRQYKPVLNSIMHTRQYTPAS